MLLRLEDPQQYAFDFNTSGAYAASVVLALIALSTVLLMTMFKPRQEA